MPLGNVPRPDPVGPIPTVIRAFLREADRRIRRYYRRHRNSAFVPCTFGGAYDILQHLAAQAEAAGQLFCEWGSGFGVVACLAALLEFDAYGIEVDSTLVRASRRLAADFDLPAEFAHGSFIPAGATRPGLGVDLLRWTEALASRKPKLLVAFGGEISCRVPQPLRQSEPPPQILRIGSAGTACGIGSHGETEPSCA